MKRFLAAFVCLSAGLLAAQELWSGRADSVQIQGKDITDPRIAVSEDGTLTVSGRNRGSARYFYLTAVIRTAPFSLKGSNSETAYYQVQRICMFHSHPENSR